MDLSHPGYSVLGEDRARVLHRLSVLAEPTSGRRVHDLSGVRSLRTTQRVLNDLVSIGMVDVQRVGATNAYQANREHLMWQPIEAIFALPASVEQRIAEILRQILDGLVVATALYGSFARGDADARSDIDVFIVWVDDVPEDTRAELLHDAAERIRSLTGNQAQLFAVRRSELDRLVAENTSLARSLRSDARRLTGVEIRQLLGAGSP